MYQPIEMRVGKYVRGSRSSAIPEAVLPEAVRQSVKPKPVSYQHDDGIKDENGDWVTPIWMYGKGFGEYP